MPAAMIDDLEVYYETHGSGPPLLMFAPGGFDATINKWLTTTAWKEMNALEALSSEHTLIVYDRRESGRSSGRVERLRWDIYARQAKGLLDHLKVDSAFVLGGCMGCSVALAFAVRYPAATRALLLHWPVGGYRWKVNGRDRFLRHLNFARDNGLTGIVERARQGKSFWQDSETGPWASVMMLDSAFAEAFCSQDIDRYLGVVSTSAHTLFDRDTAPGAEPEEIIGVKVPVLIVPGDDPSHATSAAHYLRECLPHPEFWNVMPPEQTTKRICERILEFLRRHA
jgi:pimeloyl-ACP methyl ester carboxylesterase